MTTEGFNEARGFTEPLTPRTKQVARMGGVCRCGEGVLVGWIGDVDENYRVAVCRTGDHVTVGTTGLSAKIYVAVENPQDVIMHTAGHADTCARRQIGTVGPDPECDCGVGADE